MVKVKWLNIILPPYPSVFPSTHSLSQSFVMCPPTDKAAGWNAPRNSLQLVHPSGYGAASTNEELNISFSPTPDFSGIAKAAAGGRAWAGVVSSAKELRDMLPEAVKAVEGGISAIMEVRLAGSW